MSIYWRFSGLFVGILCVAIAFQSIGAIGSEIYYEVFKPGDTVTDQSTDSSHSYLVGYEGQVPDTEFADKIAKTALAAHASLYMVFNQCFSGGFIDELSKLGGTQFIFTAARHSETASYGSPAPSGVDLDSTDTFNIALADGNVPASIVAAESVALNPFGPNPNAKRIGESMGSEHAQYLAIGGGDQLRPANFADRGIAILWAGHPAERDGKQMSLMIDRLISMGFNANKIWLFYGAGTIEASHPIAKTHFVGKAQPINLQAALPKNLFSVFENSFNEKNSTPPEFVFFYVGDHGGLNFKEVAKTGFTPDPLVAPNFSMKPGIKTYGNK